MCTSNEGVRQVSRKLQLTGLIIQQYTHSLPPHLSPTQLSSTPLLSSLSSLPPDTHHLLYLGHPTTSTKSTTTVAIVTRCRVLVAMGFPQVPPIPPGPPAAVTAVLLNCSG